MGRDTPGKDTIKCFVYQATLVVAGYDEKPVRVRSVSACVRVCACVRMCVCEHGWVDKDEVHTRRH